LLNPRLKGKDISSFLISPLQRLPRYKLLIDAILKNMPESKNCVFIMGSELSNHLENLLVKANEKANKFISYSEIINLKLKLKYQDKNMVALYSFLIK
jgi:hypothetical protein